MIQKFYRQVVSTVKLFPSETPSTFHLDYPFEHFRDNVEDFQQVRVLGAREFARRVK